MPDIEENIRKGLRDSDSDDSAKYIDWIRSAAIEYSQQTRHVVIFILVLATAFWLVSESPGTSLTIGSFRIYEGSAVLQFIPALVALCFLQLVFGTRQLIDYRSALRASVRHWKRSAAENGLDALILPSSLLYWNVTSSFDPAVMGKGEYRFTSIVSQALFGVLIGGELAFQVLSYLKLFDITKTSKATLIISAIIAAAATIVAFGYLLWLNIDRIANMRGAAD